MGFVFIGYIDIDFHENIVCVILGLVEFLKYFIIFFTFPITLNLTAHA